jgi:ssDNA-binding Zn-finger/Zn-ribbon topoisomerase 1
MPAMRADEITSATDCPLCSSQMILRRGKFGEFYGCRRFPDCRATMTAAEANAGTVDANTVRRKVASAANRERSARASQNHLAEQSVEQWRAAMIAADTSTEPPFDPTPKEMLCDVDREFAAMFR